MNKFMYDEIVKHIDSSVISYNIKGNHDLLYLLTIKNPATGATIYIKKPSLGTIKVTTNFMSTTDSDKIFSKEDKRKLYEYAHGAYAKRFANLSDLEVKFITKLMRSNNKNNSR